MSYHNTRQVKVDQNHVSDKESQWVTITQKLDAIMSRLKTVGKFCQSQEKEGAVICDLTSYEAGVDMPVPMRGFIQSLQIDCIVYVGGGWTDNNKDIFIVMTYNTQSCQWQNLPPCSIWGFAMTSIRNKLVLVGGKTSNDDDSSELMEWQPDTELWTCPFPPMPTPRYAPSAISYKDYLIVAGGQQDYHLQDCVEILNVCSRQWSVGLSTPTPWHSMKSTTIGDTWYLMGGDCDDKGWGPDVYYVSLEALISRSALNRSKVWQKLPSLNCICSCPLNIGRSLLAIGGADVNSWRPVCTIQCYIPETNSWVRAGQLPYEIYHCTSILTSNKVHIMGGQDRETTLNNVFTAMSP